MSDPLVGTLVDDWKITGQLGEGAMGAVYEARHNGRRAAFKIAHPNKLSSDSMERFRREAQMLMELDHPNVVRCFAAGENPNFVYLALEYMGGGTLQERIDREPLSVDQAVGVVRRVLKALVAVHAAGIVHRDVKPDNILLDARGRPKLGDFSMSRHRDHRRITAKGTILGTADFMAPEQLDGAQVDHRADLYALGATLYALVTGKPPYEGRSSLAVLKQHRDAPIPDPGALRPDASRITSVVASLMAKDPDQRPADAKAALALFDDLPEDSIAGPPLTPLSGFAPLRMPSPTLVLVRRIAALCLIVLGLAAATYGAIRAARIDPFHGVVGAGAVVTYLDRAWPALVALGVAALIERALSARAGARA